MILEEFDLDDLKEKKRFLLSIKGTVKLVEAFNFPIPSGNVIKQKYIEITKVHS